MTDNETTQHNQKRYGRAKISAAQVDTSIHDAVVFNENGDRFMTGAVEAMTAAQRFQRETEARGKIVRQVENLMDMIQEFCQENSTITHAIIGFEFTGWACEFATAGEYRDTDFADAMSEFAVDIHAKFPDMSIAFHTYPACRAGDDELVVKTDKRMTVYTQQDDAKL